MSNALLFGDQKPTVCYYNGMRVLAIYYGDMKVWSPDETYYSFDDTCTVVITKDEVNLKWHISIYKDYGTSSQINISSSLDYVNVWVYDVETSARAGTATKIPNDVITSPNVIPLSYFTTAGGTFRVDLTYLTSKLDGTQIQKYTGSTVYLTNPCTFEPVNFVASQAPFIKITPTSDITLNSYSFYTSSNSSMSSSLKSIAQLDSSSSKAGAGKYKCISTFDLTVTDTGFLDSTGKEVYQYKCTPSAAVTLAAGETYLLSVGVSQYGSANIVDQTNRFNSVKYTVTEIQSWAVVNTPDSYFQEYASVTELTDEVSVLIV